MASESKQKYDLVVFGASGFTGQYVVEEIARTIAEEKSLTWAVAGRNMAKLQNVLAAASKYTEKELEDTPIIIADITSQQSLVDMAAQCRIVLNCVGPYRFWGKQVVEACIESGASHIDISGEPEFLEKIQFWYHSKARASGVYIVGSCGWDSIPADMGVTYTREQFQGDLNGVEAFINVKAGSKGGGIHYGTWQSAIHGLANAGELIALRKQLYPTPLPKPKHFIPKRGMVFHSKAVDRWSFPFMGSDKSVIYRTQRYLHENKERPVQFNTYMTLPNFISLVGISIFGIMFGILAKFKAGRYLLETFPRLFSFGLCSHAGPTREQIMGTSFTMKFFGTGYSKKLGLDEVHEEKPDKKIATMISGPEPGYIATPICLVQAAYTLLTEADSLPKGGGVFTPGAAFRNTSLVERLDKHNVKFQVVERS